MSAIAVVGSINMDLTSYLERWPGIGETVAAKQTTVSLGGKGANQAIAADLLGAEVTLIGAVGTDGFATDVISRLSKTGIECRIADIAGVSTGMAVIDIVGGGDNIIRLAQGANAYVVSETVQVNAPAIASSNVLLLQNEVSLAASLEAASIARAAGATVIMDPAPAPSPMWSRDVFSAFDIITPNESEVHAILGTRPKDLNEGQQAVEALVVRGLQGVILTMGSAGVAWSINGSTGKMAAPKVDSVDTVAAGDCFNGALGMALGEGRTIEAAIRLAAHAAALATTRRGAAESLPSRSEVLAFSSLETNRSCP